MTIMTIEELATLMDAKTIAGHKAALYYNQRAKYHDTARDAGEVPGHLWMLSIDPVAILDRALIADHLDPTPRCGETIPNKWCNLPMTHGDTGHLFEPFST